MAPTDRHDSILMHPALAGRTLMVRHGGSWAAFEIMREGNLGSGQPLEADPTTLAWRGGLVR